MKTYLGIDLGTSGVKCLLCTKDGNILARKNVGYPVLRPQEGWTEQYPQHWWTAVKAAVRAVVTGELAPTVAAIALSGQMHGLVASDGEGNVIRPCILWNDGRTGAETDYLNKVVGRENLVNYTGNIAFAGFTAPKLLWLKKHERDNFNKIHKILLPKDYINYKFTGRFGTDYSDAAGTLLLDVKAKRWSEEMCGICGILPHQLPVLYESFAPAGTLSKDSAAELGLNCGVLVAAGAADNASAAVGTGTVLDGGCNISLGTSGTLFISTEKFPSGGGGALHRFCHANGKWHFLGCILSAASCRSWWTDIIKQGYEANERDILNADSAGLYFLPYLAGERSPHNDVDARGAFIGLTHNTTRGQLSRAVMEGVAFALKECMQNAVEAGICPNEATICGGGVKSAAWRQIMADVLNIPIKTLECEEGPALGAAILAMAADNAYPDVQSSSAAIVKCKEVVHPEKANAETMYKKYMVYKQLYPALKPIFPQLRVN